MQTAKANLDIFGETLLSLAQMDRNILAVTSDSRGSGKLTAFGKTLPQQIIEVGIAEQNLVGVAAGLSAAGKQVFAVSPACFLTARALEQIKNDVAYSDHPVKLIGISAGVSYGALGSTHHSLHDLAALLAVNNIDIVVPADNFETRAVIEASLTHPRPLYIRFGKAVMPHLYGENAEFSIGKANTLREGKDGVFIATGETVIRAMQAAELLAASGVSFGVISMHSLRPFDEAALLSAARATGCVITVEEHSVHGGLGSLCAAALLQNGVHPRFKIIALPDEPTVHGSQTEIFNHYGIHPEGLAHTARALLGKE